jgi:hypothetical protein
MADIHHSFTASGNVWFPCRSHYLARSVRSAFLGFHANMRHRRSYQGQAGADSESAREITWQWFANDLLSRRAPDGWIILIATPFHEDDLMGPGGRKEGAATAGFSGGRQSARKTAWATALGSRGIWLRPKTGNVSTASSSARGRDVPAGQDADSRACDDALAAAECESVGVGGLLRPNITHSRAKEM